MKKFFTFHNIQAVLFIALTVVETVLMILFKPLSVGTVLLVQFGVLLCIAVIRFAYQIALLGNRWHSFWNRRYSSRDDDEPSDFAVGSVKVSGYVVMFLLQIILFL